MISCTQRAASWWECGYKDDSEWTCEGSPKLRESRRLRGSCPLSVGCIW